MDKNFKPAEVIAPPDDTTLKNVKNWERDRARKENQLKKAQRPQTFTEKPKPKEAEETKAITNAEIAASREFNEWCQERGITASKRTASKYREEFENYLKEKEGASAEKAA